MGTATADAPVFEIRPRDPRLAEWLTDLPADIFNDRLYQSIELMERYSVALAGNVLREFGAPSRMTDWQSPTELCSALGFKSSFAPSLGWLLDRAAETGHIERRQLGDTHIYRANGERPEVELPQLRSLAMGVDPGNAATLDLLDHAAAIYIAVARGEQTAEQALFGSKGIGLWLNYFHNHNLTYAVNNWVAALAVIDRITDRPPCSILELGAGAGSATGALLHLFQQRDLLPRINRYVVTEPNAFFRRRAQRELCSRYPKVPLEWDGLDLNARWADQISGSGEFDVVFAVNVFHVSKDLRFSLHQAASALRKGGWLVIGECVRPFNDQPIYPELMFQNLDSFNNVVTDPEIRPRPGFLTPEHWRRAFADTGFSNIKLAPEIERIRDVYAHFFTTAICGQKS